MLSVLWYALESIRRQRHTVQIKMLWAKKKSVEGLALGQREYVFFVSKFILYVERCKSTLVHSFKLQ